MSRGRICLMVVVLVIAGLFFGLSDPSRVPSFVLIIGFGLMAAVLYQIVSGVLTLGSWYGVLSDKRSRHRLALVVTGLAVSLMALQSIGQLSHRDVLVLIPLMIGAYFYSYAARAE